MKKIIIIVAIMLSLFSIKISYANDLNFYWNTNLSICIPFAPSFSFTGWNGKWSISFNTNCKNNCYIPMFWINGGMYLGKNNFKWAFNFGLYYDCSDKTITKEEIIDDYCRTIEKKVISKYVNASCKFSIFNPLSWMFCFFQFMMNMWNNMYENVWSKIPYSWWFNLIFKDTSKKYITVFNSPDENKEFYNIYCVDDKYKKDVKICKNNVEKYIKYYDLYEELKNWAKIWDCGHTWWGHTWWGHTWWTGNNLIIDKKNSSIILDFSKDYGSLR